MLQNARVTAFTISKLLRENQHKGRGGGGGGGWGGGGVKLVILYILNLHLFPCNGCF